VRVSPFDNDAALFPPPGRDGTVLPPPPWWYAKAACILGLQNCRVFMLSFCVGCVPLFVLLDKADAVSLVLNTVATLYVLEVDDLALLFLDSSWTKPILDRPLRVEDSLVQHTNKIRNVTNWLPMLFAMATLPLATLFPGGGAAFIQGIHVYLYTTGCCFSQIASITDRMQMGCWKEDGKRPWSEEAKALDKQAKQLLQKHLGGSDGGHWGFWAMQFFDFAQYGLFAVVYSLFLCFGVPPTAPAGYVYPMQLNGYNPIAPVGLVGFRPDV